MPGACKRSPSPSVNHHHSTFLKNKNKNQEADMKKWILDISPIANDNQRDKDRHTVLSLHLHTGRRSPRQEEAACFRVLGILPSVDGRARSHCTKAKVAV